MDSDEDPLLRLFAVSPWYVAMTFVTAMDFGVYETEHWLNVKTQLVELKDPGSLLLHSTLPVGLLPVTLAVQIVALPMESGFGLQETDVLVGVEF